MKYLAILGFGIVSFSVGFFVVAPLVDHGKPLNTASTSATGSAPAAAPTAPSSSASPAAPPVSASINPGQSSQPITTPPPVTANSGPAVGANQNPSSSSNTSSGIVVGGSEAQAQPPASLNGPAPTVQDHRPHIDHHLRRRHRMTHDESPTNPVPPQSTAPATNGSQVQNSTMPGSSPSTSGGTSTNSNSGGDGSSTPSPGSGTSGGDGSTQAPSTVH